MYQSTFDPLLLKQDRKVIYIAISLTTNLKLLTRLTYTILSSLVKVTKGCPVGSVTFS